MNNLRKVDYKQVKLKITKTIPKKTIEEEKSILEMEGAIQNMRADNEFYQSKIEENNQEIQRFETLIIDLETEAKAEAKKIEEAEEKQTTK